VTENPTAANPLAELGKITASGTAADGRIRLTLTAVGQLTELIIEPKAMRLDASQLSAAIIDAFNAAQGELEKAMSSALAAAPIMPPDLKCTLDDLGANAFRRIDEMTALMTEVAGRVTSR